MLKNGVTRLEREAGRWLRLRQPKNPEHTGLARLGTEEYLSPSPCPSSCNYWFLNYKNGF